MIKTYSDLKYYLSEDRKALGVGKKWPALFGDEIWKIEIELRILEYIINTKNRTNNIFLKVLARMMSYHFKRRCAKRCCEIPVNCIGPGLCIWHGFNIIINPLVKIGRNFGISANCNVGHAKGKVPTIGDNVTMSFGSQVLGDVKICNNVTIGAKSLVLKSIEQEFCTVAGIPAKILSVKDPTKPLIRG